jgi:hypothetical protein
VTISAIYKTFLMLRREIGYCRTLWQIFFISEIISKYITVRIIKLVYFDTNLTIELLLTDLTQSIEYAVIASSIRANKMERNIWLHEYVCFYWV